MDEPDQEKARAAINDALRVIRLLLLPSIDELLSVLLTADAALKPKPEREGDG